MFEKQLSRHHDHLVETKQRLRIVDLEGRQGVDFLCYNADDPGERYNAPNTVKAAGNITLNEGTVLYSDFARPLMKVIADTCGGHDTIGGWLHITATLEARTLRSQEAHHPLVVGSNPIGTT